ncbi:hypothetical protein T01_2964 [Trichinella spiralis]|nr:hypothetical protein T01_2964 [Trichinella spiralis]
MNTTKVRKKLLADEAWHPKQRSKFQTTPASNTLFRSSVKAKINDVADRTRRRIIDVVCQVSTWALDTYRHANAE